MEKETPPAWVLFLLFAELLRLVAAPMLLTFSLEDRIVPSKALRTFIGVYIGVIWVIIFVLCPLTWLVTTLPINMLVMVAAITYAVGALLGRFFLIGIDDDIALHGEHGHEEYRLVSVRHVRVGAAVHLRAAFAAGRTILE